MNNCSIYALLVRSEEKGRSIMETVVYAMCIVSVVAAMWQFLTQVSELSLDSFKAQARPAAWISHDIVTADLDTRS
jgi:ABC-type sugar transport system permease subunit